MTKLYLQTTLVHAWADKHEGGKPGPGYSYTDENGQLKWLDKDAFEALHMEIGPLTDLPVSQKRIEIAHAMLKPEVDALAERATGPEFPHLEKPEQEQIHADLQAMRSCLAILGDRIATFSLPKPAQAE